MFRVDRDEAPEMHLIEMCCTNVGIDFTTLQSIVKKIVKQ